MIDRFFFQEIHSIYRYLIVIKLELHNSKMSVKVTLQSTYRVSINAQTIEKSEVYKFISNEKLKIISRNFDNKWRTQDLNFLRWTLEMISAACIFAVKTELTKTTKITREKMFDLPNWHPELAKVV